MRTIPAKDNGVIIIPGLSKNKYVLTVSFIGFTTKEITLPDLSDSTPVVHLGNIYLSTALNTLKEAVITREQSYIKFELDKITYNVEADPDSKTMMVLDILRKVPLVTVDADDNIQLKGNGNYKVLINGRTSSLFVQNPKDIFKIMPASNIKSIEVITNPPAKYDADGLGGIINIITRTNIPGGYNGTVNLTAASPTGYSGSTYLTVKEGKIGFSGNYSYIHYSLAPAAVDLYRNDLTDGTGLNENGTVNANGNLEFLTGDLTYEIDSLNLLEANYSFKVNKISSTSIQNTQSTDQGALVQEYNRLNTGDFSWRGNEYGLDYQYTSPRNKDQILTLSYKINLANDGNSQDYSNEPILNFPAGIEKSGNAVTRREQSAQLDYVKPFGQQQVLECGVKSILRYNNSNYDYLNLNELTGEYIADSTQANNFNYSQDIYSAYSSLNLKKGKWEVKAGVRAEDTKVSADFITSAKAVTQSYINFFPSVAIARSLNKVSTIRLSYTQRIERPGLYYLNPYIDRTDPKNIRFGNPGLQPAINNSFALSYNSMIKGAIINIDLSYYFTNNSIQQYSFLENDSVSETSFANIGKSNNLGISLFCNIPVSKRLKININESAHYIHLSSIIDNAPVSNESVSESVNGYMSYVFNKDWRAGANFGYSTGTILLQGKLSGYISNSFSVNKQFLKDKKATLSFSISNPFQENRRTTTTISTEEFYQVQDQYLRVRRLNLSFNYRFGRFKSAIAHKKRGIVNDDLKESPAK